MAEDASQRVASVLDFIERCGVDPDVPSLIAEFYQLVGKYGFGHAVGGAWSGFGPHRSHRFFFNNWPASWIDLYNQHGFFADDPYVAESRRRTTPFLWDEIVDRPDTLPRAREIHRIGWDYGWRQVLGIPIHGPFNFEGMVSMASMEPLILSLSDRALLRAASMTIHERCRRSIEPAGDADPDANPVLTKRELECMRWVAAGKTDWEIAQLLGIAPPTAHYHVERAKKKLKTSSRTGAVALLVLQGLI